MEKANPGDAKGRERKLASHAQSVGKSQHLHSKGPRSDNAGEHDASPASKRLLHVSATSASQTSLDAKMVADGHERRTEADTERPKSHEKSIKDFLQMCSRCKMDYYTKENHSQACQFHPESFSGETKQRWAAPGNEEGAAEVHFFYSCCGASDVNAPGCATGPHRGYGENEHSALYLNYA